jgi:hypothetical protein
LAIVVAGVRAEEKPIVTPPQTACHGTRVDFVETPSEAAKLAAKQKKLVMVLHVSGYFEDSNFT